MAESILDILFRTKKTGTGDKDAAGGLKNLGGAFENITGVSFNAAAGFAAVAGAISFSISAAAEAQGIQKQLDAVIRSTGGAAGLTASDINAMAEEFSELTAVEDDTIVKASNVMLTFTKIGKEVFPDATLAAMNMSAALGQDLQSSVVQVGKALNDPIQGITALSRVGVSFTEEQKAMIEALVETGDVMGAQRLILAELNTEFGGQAAAAADTYEGKLARLKNTIGNVAEEIGGPLIDGLSEAADVMNLLMNMGRKTAEAFDEHNTTMANTATSYAAYRDEMIRAADAAGLLNINLTTAQTEGMGAAVDQAAREVGIFTEAEWMGIQAAQQWNSDQRESQMAANATASATRSAAAATEEHTASLEEQLAASKDYVDGFNDLQDATRNLEKTQKDWLKGTGGDVVAELEKGWMNSDQFAAALGAVDEMYGTGFQKQQDYKDDVKELVDEYRQTGNLENFKRKLGELRDEYMKNDERVQAATLKVQQFKTALDNIPTTKEVYIYLHAITDEVNSGPRTPIGPTPICFIGGTLVNTPGGLRPIREIRAGELVQVLTEEGDVVNARVKWVVMGQRDDLVVVRLSDGRRFVCSPNHPWRVRDQATDFIHAGQLARDMELVSIPGAARVFVYSVSPYPAACPVYDLRVEHPEHTFLVDGIMVHNKEAPDGAGASVGKGTVMPASVGTGSGANSGVTININNPQINNGMDLEQLMYEISQRVQ